MFTLCMLTFIKQKSHILFIFIHDNHGETTQILYIAEDDNVRIFLRTSHFLRA